jgi:hypothetical protein
MTKQVNTDIEILTVIPIKHDPWEDNGNTTLDDLSQYRGLGIIPVGQLSGSE